jgi:hypothetical protein
MAPITDRATFVGLFWSDEIIAVMDSININAI